MNDQLFYRQYSVYHHRRLKKAGSCTSSQSNDAPDLPASVSFGKALSQWENEFDEDEWIVELVIGGAKSYSYRTYKGKVVIKQKRITMDVANTDVITFKIMKDMVLSQGTLKSAKTFTFATDSNTRDVVTKFIGPQYSLNSQRETENHRLRYATIWPRRERQDASKIKQAGRQAKRRMKSVIITVQIKIKQILRTNILNLETYEILVMFSNKYYIEWCTNQITPFTYHVGHNIPESKGGETTINNLFPVCAKCKVSMSNKYTIEDWVEKFK